MKEMKQEKLNGLTTRQWRLKDWLEDNHISQKYHSIEEIVENVKYNDGTPCYELNRNPYRHDKCVALSFDVRAINWNFCQGYKLILKDEKGGVKLAESKEEFEKWWNEQNSFIENKYKYLNNLKAKAKRHGVIFFINQANNVVDNPAPTKVYIND